MEVGKLYPSGLCVCVFRAASLVEVKTTPMEGSKGSVLYRGRTEPFGTLDSHNNDLKNIILMETFTR